MRSAFAVSLSTLVLVLGIGSAQSWAAQPGAKAAPRPPENTVFASWRDPREDAFQLGIPAGWKVSGGTFRSAAVDVRHVVRAESPDGTIRVFLDDADLRPRQVPDAMMRQVGFREGQEVRGPWGGPVLLSRYLTGEQFARQYIEQKLCPRGQITQSSPLPLPSRELNARIQPIAARQGTAVQANVGEAYFRCGTGHGYTFANTVLVAPVVGGPQLWAVHQLGSVVVSDPSQAPFGTYVLNRMMETFALNPQWEARQAKLTQDTTGAVTQIQRAMAQGIAQHAQRQAASASAGGFNHPNDTRLPTDLRAKWAKEDVSRQAFSDATMGQRWMHNPMTGENVRVDNSIQNPLMDHSKNIVAGPPDGSPPPGSHGQYTPLQPGWQQ